MYVCNDAASVYKIKDLRMCPTHTHESLFDEVSNLQGRFIYLLCVNIKRLQNKNKIFEPLFADGSNVIC